MQFLLQIISLKEKIQYFQNQFIYFDKSVDVLQGILLQELSFTAQAVLPHCCLAGWF